MRERKTEQVRTGWESNWHKPGEAAVADLIQFILQLFCQSELRWDQATLPPSPAYASFFCPPPSLSLPLFSDSEPFSWCFICEFSVSFAFMFCCPSSFHPYQPFLPLHCMLPSHKVAKAGCFMSAALHSVCVNASKIHFKSLLWFCH